MDGLNLYAYVGNNPATWTDPLGLFIDGGVLTGPAAYLIGGAIAGGVIAAYPETREAAAEAAEYVAGAFKRFPENAANVYGQLKDFFATDPVMMDEVDDGEDASSVTPTDDEEGICEVEPGPGKDPQKKDPKSPKKKKGPDVTEDIYDELKELLEGMDAEEIPHLERLHQDSILNKNTLDYWRGKSIDEIIESLKLPGPEQLRIRPDGTVVQGNHRIKVLEELGYDTSTLVEYADIIKKDPLAPWEW